MGAPQQVNGWDVISTAPDDKLFVTDPVEAADGSGWCLMLGWHNVRPGTDKPHDATCFTNHDDMEKLAKLRDGLSKLIEVGPPNASLG